MGEQKGPAIKAGRFWKEILVVILFVAILILVFVILVSILILRFWQGLRFRISSIRRCLIFLLLILHLRI